MVEAAFDLACELPVTAVTKLGPPRVGADHLPRARLLGMLEHGERCRLTLVSAPAGFGKTSLLAHWAERTARPVAWLMLEEGDCDPATFWRHVLEALEHAGLEPRAREPFAELAFRGPAV